MLRVRCATALVLAFLVDHAAHAADPALPAAWPLAEHEALLRPASFTASETQKLIEALSSPDFQTREAASRELKKYGIDVYPGLRERYTSDPELQARLQKLVEGREIAIPPVARKVTSCVSRYLEKRDTYLKSTRGEAPVAAVRLLPLPQRIISDMNQPRHDAIAEALAFIEQHESDPKLREALEMCHRLVADADARLLIARGKIQEAESRLHAALDLQLPMRQDYAVLVALRRGGAFNPDQELAACDIAGEARDQLAAYLFRAAGNYARAADYAANLPVNNAQIFSEMFIRADRFDLLTRPVIAPAKDEPSDATKALAIMLSSPPGDESALDARVAAALAAVPADKPVLRDRTLQMLVQTGRISQAINFARQTPEGTAAALRLLLAQGRVREALSLLDPEDLSSIEAVLQLNDLGLQEASTRVLVGIKLRQSRVKRLTAQYQFDIGSEWERRGDLELAASWRELAYSTAGASAKGYSDAQAPLRDLMKRQSELMSRLETEKDIESHVQITNDLSQVSRQFREAQSQPLPTLEPLSIASNPVAKTSQERAELTFWYSVVRAEFGPGQGQEHTARAVALLKGQVPPAEVHRLLMNWKNSDALSIGARRLALMGREDLALDMVQKALERDETPAAWAYPGDWAMENNDFKRAAECYRRAATANITDPTLMYRLGLALSHLPESKAQGEELIAYVPWMVLSNRDSAMQVAVIMRRMEGASVSDAWYDNFLTHHQRSDDCDQGNHYDRLRRNSEAQGNYAAALAYARCGLFFPAFPRSENPPHLLAAMAGYANYQRARALDANARKDAPALVDALNRHIDSAAPDLALLQQTLPTLKSLDPTAATAILARAINRLQPTVDDYPAAKPYVDQLQTLKSLDAPAPPKNL